ncbi:unnamed protein product [Rotaria sordida]|uniref:DUF4440 domain-containing protein n=1 Tax=Rotaria sordida TaxID=392033 RepID=A0A815EWS6_9BILA|nr:unnamed protein product [Rotaria sordida]CAF1317113.1 unnamed protein product [Rotaria sordida]CAF3605030.1 unnamed protein product [Rotaria sordida]CAF3626597.1 unnamed protein product [Rotaria sordida]
MSFEIIDKLNRDFQHYFNNDQIKQAVSSYADDARLFSSDKQSYQGLNQIEKYYSDTKKVGNTKVELHTEQVIQCDSNYLIEISTYKTNTGGGNSVVIWKKDGQFWKKIIDIFN